MGKLIVLVRENPCLYDTSFIAAASPQEVEKAWLSVSRGVRKNVKHCQTRWNKYLKSYRDYLQNGAKINFAPSEMEFVTPHLNTLPNQRFDEQDVETTHEAYPAYKTTTDGDNAEDAINPRYIPPPKRVRRPEVDVMPDSIRYMLQSSTLNNLCSPETPGENDAVQPDLHAFGVLVSRTLQKFATARQIYWKSEIFDLLRRAELEELDS